MVGFKECTRKFLSFGDGGFQRAFTQFFLALAMAGFRERSRFLKASAMVDFRVAIVRRAGYGAGYHAAAGERFAQTAKFD